MRRFKLFNIYSILFFLLSQIIVGVGIQAEIIFDGTLGQADSLSGPNFSITSNFGKQIGANLFHSFHSFNIDTQETAIFKGIDD